VGPRSDSEACELEAMDEHEHEHEHEHGTPCTGDDPCFRCGDCEIAAAIERGDPDEEGWG
jgi:hypothetical protein